MESPILKEDIFTFVKHFKLGASLHGKLFLITGATGLIGSILVKCLIALNENIKITIPVRDEQKAKEIFGAAITKLNVVIAPSLEKWTKDLQQPYHYIIHCASPTVGKYMEDNPVETFRLAYETTYNLLRLAKHTNVEGFVYISSLEYYGQIFDDRLMTEKMQGYIDPMSARSSYPMGKRAAEYLCYAFAKEYGVHTRVARLTQTFGAGVSINDNRVFVQFAKSIINGSDIILHTKGESSKPYCYTIDCVNAILHILLKGTKGEAYNVANEDTYINIYQLANYLRENFNSNVHVRIEMNNKLGYAPVTKLHLSTKKLRELGWVPIYGLRMMFERLIADLKYKKNG